MQPGPNSKLSGAARVANRLWYLAGLAAMLASKLRSALLSYSRPRPFPAGDCQAAADYDMVVFENWSRYLHDYLGRSYDWAGKTVLELGPGPDLGTGVLALAAGAERYMAFDKFPLAKRAEPAMYEQLLGGLALPDDHKARLLEEVRKALAGRGDCLRYVLRGDFDLSAAGISPVDLVVSQAAFEHFDDPQRTIAQLSSLARPGAVFLAVVDFQTHTRWLRNRDPLNIYRYSPRLYRLLRYPGCPNRARPDDYAATLARSGWTDIRITPLLQLDPSYLSAVTRCLASAFRRDAAQMQYLTMVLCATRLGITARS